MSSSFTPFFGDSFLYVVVLSIFFIGLGSKGGASIYLFYFFISFISSFFVLFLTLAYFSVFSLLLEYVSVLIFFFSVLDTFSISFAKEFRLITGVWVILTFYLDDPLLSFLSRLLTWTWIHGRRLFFFSLEGALLQPRFNFSL